MKSLETFQKNHILFCGPVQLIVSNNRKSDQKIQRVLYIDLNGGKLFKKPKTSQKKGFSNRPEKDETINSLQSLEEAVASFSILPEHQVYQIKQKDTAIAEYLKKIGVTLQQNEYVCQFCNKRDLFMFPIFFKSKRDRHEFHQAVLIFQIYYRYLAAFQKVSRENGISIPMNMRLIRKMARSIALQDFIIDPEDFSVVKLEDFELQIVRDCIQRVATRQQKSVSRSSLDPNRSHISNSAPIFSLRLRYKIVDAVSLNYLRSIISDQTMYRSMRQFDVTGSSINDNILSMIMINRQVRKLDSGSMYHSLVILNLSKNELTDLCFISLSTLVSLTPMLRDLNLSGNKIKLSPSSTQKREQNRNSRLSTSNIRMSRLSNSLSPSMISKSDPFFIQFLQCIQYQPINYLNLDHNIVEEPETIVSYIIEGQNVPVKYLSIRNNKFSQVDKIRMAKLICSEIKERGETQDLAFVDFGEISVVDSEVFNYFMLLRELNVQLGIGVQEKKQIAKQEFQNIGISSRPISKLTTSLLNKILENSKKECQISITRNKQWQLCDQEGILDISNLYKTRRKTSIRRSQIVNSILVSNSYSPSNSAEKINEQNNTDEKKQEVTAETFKPTVCLLREAYVNSNYSGIGLYKQLLQEYNMEVYNMKIIPLLFKYEKDHRKDQQKIIMQLNSFINFGDGMSENKNEMKNMVRIKQKKKEQKKEVKEELKEEQINDKLDALISRMLSRRIEFEVKNQLTLYQNDLDQEEELTLKYTNNVLTFLIYLRIKRDQYIEKLINHKTNPLDQINKQLRSSASLYSSYYLARNRQLCQDNYLQVLLQKIEENRRKFTLGQNPPSQNSQSVPAVSGALSQKMLNEQIKQTYLYKCSQAGQYSGYNSRLTRQDQFLCYFQPKLMFTGFLIKYYSSRYVPKLGSLPSPGLFQNIPSKLLVTSPTKGQIISNGIDNFLEFVARYNMLSGSNPCLNPNYSLQFLIKTEQLKIAVYNPSFEASLIKFSQLVVAFIKFLHFQPDNILPQTLQYLNFLINIVLEEEDSFNIQCMSNQFFLQLFTFNAEIDLEARVRQVHPHILLTLVQFATFYMMCSQVLEKYIIGHLLRAEAVLDIGHNGSRSRIVRYGKNRYLRKQDQLPPEIVSYIFENPGNLQMPIKIKYWDIRNLTDKEANSEGLEQQQSVNEYQMSQFEAQIHILTLIGELLEEIEKSDVVKKIEFQDNQMYEFDNNELVRNSNWGIFVKDNQTNKIHLLLPSARENLNVYSLYRDRVIGVPNSKTPKKQLLVRPLLLPIEPMHNILVAEVQQKWWHQQINHAFWEYGSYLPLINSNVVSKRNSQSKEMKNKGSKQNGSLADTIVDSIVSHAFLFLREKLEEVLLFEQDQWKVSLKFLCEDYTDNLSQYTPKGTHSVLTSEQTTYIKAQLQSRLQSSIMQLRKVDTYYSQLSQQNLRLFQEKCVLIAHPTSVINPISQQQALFTIHGILLITRVIYAEAVLWTHVIDIRLVWDEDMLVVKAIQILYSLEQDVRIMKIVGGASPQERVFINSCVLLLKNIGLTIVSTDRERLYRNLYSGEGKIHEQQKKEWKRSRNKNTNENGKRKWTVYEQLQCRIEYKQGASKTAIGLEQQKSQPIEESYQKQNTKTNKEKQKEAEYSGERGLLQRDALKAKQEKKQIGEEKEEKGGQRQKMKESSGQMDLDTIVGGGDSKNDVENMVVTNGRRSSRRQLPKRRSSRDK